MRCAIKSSARACERTARSKATAAPRSCSASTRTRFVRACTSSACSGGGSVAPWYETAMPEQRFDAVVTGARPGGHPAAIRLGQLKVKTAIIEREYIGGVCLNVGCIPSKAVIHAAKMFDKLGHSEDIGISIPGKPVLDMARLQAWKGGMVGKLTGGVRTLLKANKVEIFDG